MSTNRKILNGFLGGIGLTVINIVVAFAQFRLLLHFLSQEQAGVWLLFLSIGSYVVLFDLGIGPTLGREISFTAGSLTLGENERALRISSLIRTCTSLAAGLSLFVLLLGTTVGWMYLRSTIPSSSTSSAHIAWNIYVVSAAINLIGQGWFAGIYGLGEVFKEKLLRCLGQLVGLGLLTAALWLKLGLTGLAVASIAQAIFTISQARRTLRLGSYDLFVLGHFDLSIIRRLIGPSLKYAATLLGGILILQTDNLVIASRLGTAFIPNYQAVSKLVTTLMALSTMLIVTTTPFQSKAHAQQNAEEIRKLLHRNLRFSLAIMTILGSVLACFADNIIVVWLGPGHFVGFAVVWVLLLIMLLEAHHTSMATATMATGRIVFLGPALLAGVLNIIFSIYLARPFGLLGVALGTLCAQVITNNWYVPWYTMRQFHLSFIDHLRGVVGPIFSLLAVTLGVGYTVRTLLTPLPLLTGLFIGASSVGFAGTVVTIFIVLSSSERKSLAFQIKKRLGSCDDSVHAN